MECGPCYLLVEWTSGSSPEARQVVPECLIEYLRLTKAEENRALEMLKSTVLEQCLLLLAHPGEGTFLFAHGITGANIGPLSVL